MLYRKFCFIFVAPIDKFTMIAELKDPQVARVLRLLERLKSENIR